jgi:hypothetical protein
MMKRQEMYFSDIAIVAMLIVVTNAVCIPDANAEAKQGGIAVFDQISCGDYVNDYNNRNNPNISGFQSKENYLNAMIFVEGYLTAVNTASWKSGGQQGTYGDRNSRASFLHNYCKAHPMQSFSTAIEALAHQTWRWWPLARINK